MKEVSKYVSRGTARGILEKHGSAGLRVVSDTRKPIYLVLILDTSGSMAGTSTVLNEMGEAVQIRKIDQLNDGMKRVIESLRSFEATNPLYKLYLQIIELNSYGQALFPEYQPVSRGFEEIAFEASGCTELRASLNTLKTYLDPKYLRDERTDRNGKGYNKAVNVILMSDGWPTDCNGVEQSGPAYRNVIAEFDTFLRDNGLDRNVDRYSLAVGADACEDMLRYFCDGGEDLGDRSRFYRVEECESIAYVIDYLTRVTLGHRTTRNIILDKDKYEEVDPHDKATEGEKDPVVPTGDGAEESATPDEASAPADNGGTGNGGSASPFDGEESDVTLDNLFDDIE